jgi:multiple antibiotic resistance protein
VNVITLVASLVTYALLSFGALFAVLSPFATVPTFLAMTENNTAAERTQMARRACGIAAVVLIVFSLAGMGILGIFRITVPAFQIAGGLVILRVAFAMLHEGSRPASVTPGERREGEQKEDISITPLAVPILCGPATLTTGVLMSSEATTWLHSGVLVLVITLIYLGTYFMLRFTARYLYLLGEITVRVVSRLMGLLLAAVAIQFIVDGIQATGVFSG